MGSMRSIRSNRLETWLLCGLVASLAACPDETQTSGEVATTAVDSGATDIALDAAVEDTPPGDCQADGDCLGKVTPGPCEAAVCAQGRCVVAADASLIGTTCDDDNPCTHGEVCGELGGCRGTLYGCPDPSECETAACDGQGGCAVTTKPGFCVIDQGCHPAGAPSPSSACYQCDPAADPGGWTPGDCACTEDGDCADLNETCVRGVCDPSTSACVAEPLTGDPCDDGEACSHSDRCGADGKCVGQSYPCGVPSPCHYSTCDGAGGCQIGVDAGSCFIGGSCRAAGSVNPDNPCLGCAPVESSTSWTASGCDCTQDDDCAPPDNPCRKSRCELATGTCVSDPNPGLPCDDGNACSVGDVCNGVGVCSGVTYSCSGASCQDVACDGVGGCTMTLRAGYCMIEAACYEDGEIPATDPCVVCDAGADPTTWTDRDCECQQDPDCADLDDACHIGRCSQGSKTCVAEVQLGAPCDDGLACTTDSACTTEGSCEGVAYECPTATCLETACDGTGGCTQDVLAGLCYIGGSCLAAGTPNVADACLICEPSVSATAWTATPCGCQSDEDCKDLDGECSLGRCETAASTCYTEVQLDQPCDDGDLCTFGDACQADASCGGVPSPCPEGLAPCLNASCDGEGGCETSIKDGFCQIGDFCYEHGTPAPGTPCLLCDSSQSQTSWSPLAVGTHCDDGVACTHEDTCGDFGVCSGSTYSCSGDSCSDADCDGGGGCTRTIHAGMCRIDGACYADGQDDPTDPCQGCVAAAASEGWTAYSEGTQCDDGNPTTSGDVCALGVCVGSCFPPAPSCLEVDPAGCPTGAVVGNKCYINDTCLAAGDAGPGACEACDPSVDQTAWTSDDPDGDGACGADDCGPDDPLRYPGAPEHCDGADNDCDGITDEGIPLCFIVSSALDKVDADPGDGWCATSGGVCSLRAAVMEANTHRELTRPVAIFVPAGTYTLGLEGPETDAAGDLDVLGRVAIRGAGAQSTTISGANTTRVFEVHPDAELRLAHVTVADGFTGPNPERGAGILNQGSTHLFECVLRDNHATWLGGGLASTPASTPSPSGQQTEVSIRRCEIYGNTAYQGGGVFHTPDNASATLWIEESAIHGNVADNAGGGIKTFSSAGIEAIILVNVTVSGNSAPIGGGGIVSTHLAGVTAALELRNCTITDNQSDYLGGGLQADDMLLGLGSTVLAGNSGPPDSPDLHLENVSVTSTGGNLIGDTTGGAGLPVGAGDLLGNGPPIDPVLGPLASNGGPTATHLLLPASPARALSTSPDGVGRDQRGAPRGEGSDDAGAVEMCDSGVENGSDRDGDGLADGCDLCPADRLNDADDDGRCADEDPCEGGTASLASDEVCDGIDNDCDGETDEAHDRCFIVDTPADGPDADPGDGICKTDFGKCTLRAAINEVNTNLTAKSAIYAPAGHYKITLPGVNGGETVGDMDIFGTVEIRGDGPGRTIFDAADVDRFFAIDADGDVLITGVTIRDGRADIGGGILNLGVLELRDCAMRSNTTETGNGYERGGAIANRAGDAVDAHLTLRRCAIESNVAGREAGGIDSFAVGSKAAILKVYDSTIAGNHARDFGGGVTVYQSGTGQSTASFVNTTFAYNSVLQISGGALDAVAFGVGGVDVSMLHCTIRGNSAQRGGGVAIAQGDLNLVNTIAAGNTAMVAGDDIVADGGGTVLLAGGALLGAFANGVGGMLTVVSGFNLFGDDANPFVVPLGTFGFHGGPTRTFPLVAGSVAVDVGVSGMVLSTDQRGWVRPINYLGPTAAPDSGAYELPRP